MELTTEQLLDAAYRERAHLVAWLAALYPAVITPAPDVDEPGWQLLYLRAGGGQMGWHIAPRDAELYAHVQRVPASDPRAQWDGHTTEQKYAQIRQYTRALSDGVSAAGGGSVVHLAPAPGASTVSCCGRTPFELPRTDRLSETLAAITCASVGRGGRTASADSPDRVHCCGNCEGTDPETCLMNPAASRRTEGADSPDTPLTITVKAADLPEVTALVQQLTDERDQAQAAVARAHRLADDMRTWCSPHGVAVLYADRIEEALTRPEDPSTEFDRLRAERDQARRIAIELEQQNARALEMLLPASAAIDQDGITDGQLVAALVMGVERGIKALRGEDPPEAGAAPR